MRKKMMTDSAGRQGAGLYFWLAQSPLVRHTSHMAVTLKQHMTRIRSLVKNNGRSATKARKAANARWEKYRAEKKNAA